MTFFAAATDPAVALSTAQLIIGLLGTLGIGSVGAAVITGAFSRKKLGADATEIISRAAAGVVERTEADNTRLRAEQDRLLREIDAERAERKAQQAKFEEIVEQHTRVLQLHAAWDHMAVRALEEAGVSNLPEPPPMYPPHSTPGDFRH